MATPKSIAEHLGAYKGQVGRSLANLLNNNKVKKLPKQGVLQPYDVVQIYMCVINVNIEINVNDEINVNINRLINLINHKTLNGLIALNG